MRIIIMLLLIAARCHGGWFNHDDYKDRWQQAEQRLEQQRQVTGEWQIATGILAMSAVILFVVGTALGSKMRRETRKEVSHE